MQVILSDLFYSSRCVDPKVRTTCLNGLSAFFTPVVYQLIVATEIQDDIIDLLIGGNIDLVKLHALKMPYNKTDENGKELIQAMAYKSREFKFFQAMTELELAM